MKAVLWVVFCLSASPSFSDQATQTDWSGGDGILGPVDDWGDQFYSSNGYVHLTDGMLSLMPHQLIAPVEFIIDDQPWAYSVVAADVNSDGVMDIVGTRLSSIRWWENTDSMGTEWFHRLIEVDFSGVRSICMADVDGDGHLDVIGAASYIDEIRWWRNYYGTGAYWTEHVIAIGFNGAHSVFAVDIDGDGDNDVLGAAINGDDITWWENADGAGTSWIEHSIVTDFDGAISVYSSDIDSDGDQDVLGAAYLGDCIAWWENANGIGTLWVEHEIENDFPGARSVFSEDLDGDGHYDVLGASFSGDEIRWWRNADGFGTTWENRAIATSIDGPSSVYATDIDGDGDSDVLGTVFNSHEISWWENRIETGTWWPKHIVDNNFMEPISAGCADFNSDGMVDVVGASNSYSATYCISWWRIYGYASTGYLVSSILQIAEQQSWNTLEWSSIEPPGTQVGFQLRSSSDYSDMGYWSDYIYPSGTSLSGILSDSTPYVQYRMAMTTSDPDTTPYLTDVCISWNPTGIMNASGDIPDLLPFSPNPGLPSRIAFYLPDACSAEFIVFNILGRTVLEFTAAEYAPGTHYLTLSDFSPGVYFCQMKTNGYSIIQRFCILK